MHSGTEAIAVSAIMLTDQAEVRDGLLQLAGAGWEVGKFAKIPGTARLVVATIFEAGGLQPGDYQATIEVRDPFSALAAAVPVTVSVTQRRDVVRVPHVAAVDVDVHSAGVWSVQVVSGELLLIRLPVLVSQSGADHDDAPVSPAHATGPAGEPAPSDWTEPALSGSPESTAAALAASAAAADKQSGRFRRSRRKAEDSD